MKKITKKLEELSALIEEEVTKREETYESRSERWQDSDKGMEYQEETDLLNEMLNQMNDWVYELTDNE